MSAFDEHEARFRVRLAALRRYRHISQTHLAETADIGRTALVRIENGTRGVHLGEALALCAALDITITAMVDPEPLVITASTTIG